MANIFTKTQDYSKPPKRNVFDLSFQNNLTLGFGQLVPVFCKEVIPGDSFRIRPTFGFNFAPMVFPVQTRMKANLHFFYVRSRTLWSDFQDFIGKTKDNLVPPYIAYNSQTSPMFKVGGLADYLGIPVNYYGSYAGNAVNDMANLHYYDAQQDVYLDSYYGTTTLVPPLSDSSITQSFRDWLSDVRLFRKVSYANDATINDTGLFYVQKYDTPQTVDRVYWYGKYSVGTYCQSCAVVAFDSNGKLIKVVQSSAIPSSNTAGYININFDAISNVSKLVLITFRNNDVPIHLPEISSYVTRVIWRTYTSETTSVNVSDMSVLDVPYHGNQNDQKERIRVSALPFRAYEAVYNSFYRDVRNNPYILDGVPEYNKYIPNMNGGADTTLYEIHTRNWEPDFLTTCVQSPQQGTAPLVGVTSTGQMTFKDEQGNTYTAQATVGDDGDTITGISVHSPDMPVGTLRALVDTISSGISISDFRNVNALQRWLEVNMRRGLRYRDQIKSHFGVDVRYDELDMPEFIGGCSQDVQVNRISQSVESVDTPLGTLGGQASCVGTSNNDITHYCDEPGFIIGIMSITPVPNYSQLLPKMFIKDNVLDYYFPEFGHIGYQPVTYKEICPLQAFRAGDELSTVFGYQRPWYEYISSVDEVHGQFRTSMRNYLINRVFNSAPVLTPSFLTVSEDDINNVFNVTDVDSVNAKIWGQVYFEVMAKRPIPMFGIPRLEA